LPDFSTCSKEDLRYTVFNDSYIFSTLPKPYIFSWDPPVVDETVLAQLPDPAVVENLVTDLQSGVDNLCLISPLSLTRRPARSSADFASLASPAQSIFPKDPSLESDPKFQELKKRLNSVRTIF
jgi:hypothetical protein